MMQQTINNDIKHREAAQLNAYLGTLSFWERASAASL